MLKRSRLLPAPSQAARCCSRCVPPAWEGTTPRFSCTPGLFCMGLNATLLHTRSAHADHTSHPLAGWGHWRCHFMPPQALIKGQVKLLIYGVLQPPAANTNTRWGATREPGQRGGARHARHLFLTFLATRTPRQLPRSPSLSSCCTRAELGGSYEGARMRGAKKSHKQKYPELPLGHAGEGTNLPPVKL